MTSFTSSRSPVFEWESGLHPEDWNSSVQRRLFCSALSSHFSEWVTCDVLSTCCSVVPVSVARGKMVGSAVLRNNSMNWLKFISNFGMDNHFHFSDCVIERENLRDWERATGMWRPIQAYLWNLLSLFICILNITGYFLKCYNFPWKCFFSWIDGFTVEW